MEWKVSNQSGPPIIKILAFNIGQVAFKLFDNWHIPMQQGAASVYTNIGALKDWVDYILSKYDD